MKVTLLHSRYSNRVPSGENMVVDAEHQALLRAGIDVRLIQTDPDRVRSSALYPLVAAARTATGRGPSFRAAIAADRPDVIHVHNVFPDLGERSVASLTGPMVVTAHNYRWGCAAGTFYRDSHICTECVDRTPLQGVKHGCHHGPLGTVPLAIAHHGGPARNPLAARASVIWCPSRLHAEKLVASGTPQDKVTVSPHFLPADLTPDPTASSRSSFMFAGRLDASKGVLDLVRRWPGGGPHLDVVGDGVLRDEVARAARGKPVLLHGTLSRQRVLSMMASARGVIFSSEWWETFGLVAVEAMAAGTPILTWGEHAVSQLVTSRGVGVVLDSSADLTQGLDLVLARPAADWATHVRERFDDEFSESAWVSRRVTEYQEVLDRSPTT